MNGLFISIFMVRSLRCATMGGLCFIGFGYSPPPTIHLSIQQLDQTNFSWAELNNKTGS